MSERIRQAVKAERTSKEYALNYYKEEADLSPLFRLDTDFLDGIFKRKGKLFDATMGRGRHVIHFAKKGFEVYGNDYNKSMVDSVRNDLKKLNLKATLYHYDIQGLSKIKNNSFDYVILMYHSMGSIPKRKNRGIAMKELARVLKPDGILVMHAHSIFHDNLKDTLLVLKTYAWHGPDMEPGDEIYFHGKGLGNTFIHYFTKRELAQMFHSANLKIIKKAYLNLAQDDYRKGLFKLLSGGFIFVGKK
ncbi:class I SAM-dependent methyltransferase [Candidatus Woesearchaeota archaeon]|nr:class I SAM-dependent methyltransferase [Candidatus Woesearchaeota archaeon]